MILLTGANGFIGSHLRKHIDCVTVDYSGCDYNGDLQDAEFVARLPDVDTVIHLAAFNSTRHFYTNPFMVLDAIVTPTMNLLKRYSGVHFVYAGSCESYAGAVNNGWASVPTPESVPLVIDDITNPRWSYASAKIAMESAVIASGIELGNTWCIVRYHNVYGPGQQNHFIPEFAERAARGDYNLYGWSDTRSFCYVQDAVEITSRVMHTRNEIINIGSPYELQIVDMAKEILSTLGLPDNDLTLHPSPAGSTPRRAADLTKMLAIVGEYNFTNIQQGLTQTLGG